MKERPIIFDGEMVRAILDGRKTETRRVIKPQPEQALRAFVEDEESTVWCESTPGDYVGYGDPGWHCPYGEPPDHLWVRETWWVLSWLWGRTNGPQPREYDSDIHDAHQIEDYVRKPSIYMPRWASRITLEVVSLSVERLWAITEQGVLAEGMRLETPTADRGVTWYEGKADDLAKRQFAPVWDRMNQKAGFRWDDNPWVWVIEFRVLGSSGEVL